MNRIAASVILLIIAVCLCSGTGAAEPLVPDLGRDGMAGLTEAQKSDLSRGKIVFCTDDKGRHSSQIEAAIVFNRSPEEVWGMLSKTEEQIRYLREIKKIEVIEKGADSDVLRFHLKVMLMHIDYQITHCYLKESLYFNWLLDPSYKGDVSELKGYWILYPYGVNKTLARYGTLVTLKHLPIWMQDAFKKKAVGKALESVRCYIDSDGTCRRKGY